MRSWSSAAGVSSWLAPGQVFIVRCASGVTRIRQRPVGGPAVSGRSRTARRASACRARRSRRAGRWRPGRRTPPKPERGGARHAVRRRPAADLARRTHRRIQRVGLGVVSSCIEPLGSRCCSRNSSSHVAITSTMASPIATMSSADGSHRAASRRMRGRSTAVAPGRKKLRLRR